MNTGSFGYLVKQGVVSVWINKVMSLASMAILTACLIILGGAGLLAVNIRAAFAKIEGENEMVVFVKDEIDDSSVRSLGDSISGLDHVAEVRFVSREEGLEIMREYLGEEGYLIDGLEDDNPLPRSFRVKLDDLDYLEDVQRRVGAMGAVDSVSAPTQLADTLGGVEKTIGVLGLVIISILLIASVVVINNTVKLTVFSRRKEINIMRYVGATNGFIRFPFVIEGLTLGFISAIIASIAVFAVYQSLAGMLAGSPVDWVSAMSESLIPFKDIWLWVQGGFFFIGMVIGAFGSSASTRRYLTV